MKRRMFKILGWITGGILLLMVIGFFWFDSQFSTQVVRDNVYLISSPTGANVTVMTGQEGLLLVDSQLKAVSFFIRRKINSISTSPIKYIINTHWHPDHNGGNGQLGKDAVIIGHENLKKRFSSPQKGYGLTKPGSYHEFKTRAGADMPDRTFTDSLEVQFNGEKVIVFHLPHAHTDTDIAVYFTKSNVLSIGDLFWKNKFPYVDTYNSGSVLGVAEGLDRIIDLTNSKTIVISGHSKLAYQEDLISTHRVISESVSIIKQKIAEGKTLNQIKKEGLSENMKSWSGSLVPESIWIEMVYKSLK